MWYRGFLCNFSETAATDRSLHDWGTNELCSYHTCRLRGHGPGIGISKFFLSFFLFPEYSTKHMFWANYHLHISIGGLSSGPDEIKRRIRAYKFWRFSVITRWEIPCCRLVKLTLFTKFLLPPPPPKPYKHRCNLFLCTELFKTGKQVQFVKNCLK